MWLDWSVESMRRNQRYLRIAFNRVSRCAKTGANHQLRQLWIFRLGCDLVQHFREYANGRC
uniref:Uncharacterized protein n=1 Tax=Anguilla anguilla TaxID=7936 RepID=A0A0E9Y021_ANGAN